MDITRPVATERFLTILQIKTTRSRIQSQRHVSNAHMVHIVLETMLSLGRITGVIGIKASSPSNPAQLITVALEVMGPPAIDLTFVQVTGQVLFVVYVGRISLFQLSKESVLQM